MESYTIHLGNLTRDLSLVALGPKLKIASFNLLGDVELVEVCATLLFEKIKSLSFDYLIGPEVKIVPLLQELSKRCGKNRYIVCRKKMHGYMTEPVTSSTSSPLTLNGPDGQLIKNKKVLVVDDVVSTGKTLAAVKNLMDMCQAQIVGFAAVAKQGDEPFELLQHDFFYLINLPLFRS